ncbi:MAG: 16S rRNA (guanine(966)-N(2))-methyltransferase RsmD [Anaerolineae bacterium]|nr:16S rRNA (guanine(966)-N(2))-methyltransferase RsmD [Anaerolineae bacterium]
MRVIAGRARGRRLLPVPGEGTRPITDRAKEALFSILGSRIVRARVLDLFAGTGGVGIEALSRGAAGVVFVERAGKAVETLRQNLETTGLTAGAEVVRGDVFRFLETPPRQSFDVVFIAPPQYQGLWLKTLEAVDAQPVLLAEGGEAIVQIFPKEYTEPTLTNLALTDERRYGSVLLLFYSRVEDVEEEEEGEEGEEGEGSEEGAE